MDAKEDSKSGLTGECCNLFWAFSNDRSFWQAASVAGSSLLVGCLAAYKAALPSLKYRLFDRRFLSQRARNSEIGCELLLLQLQSFFQTFFGVTSKQQPDLWYLPWYKPSAHLIWSEKWDLMLLGMPPCSLWDIVSKSRCWPDSHLLWQLYCSWLLEWTFLSPVTNSHSPALRRVAWTLVSVFLIRASFFICMRPWYPAPPSNLHSYVILNDFFDFGSWKPEPYPELRSRFVFPQSSLSLLIGQSFSK